jgi:hypothetical protein
MTHGQLHPHRDDGSELDATFELNVVPVFDLVFHHKAGGRGSDRALNQDYHEALETLLSRLARVNATILGISVDSSVARELDEQNRELGLDFPIGLHAETNAYELRREITRAQKGIARRPTAKPGGGNDQKRMRMTLSFDSPSMTREQLAGLLVDGPTALSSGEEARAPQASSRSSDRHTRTSLRDLIGAGLIPPDGILRSHYRGGGHRARYNDSGIEVRGKLYATPSEAAVAATGRATNGWAFWHINVNGQVVPLSRMRDVLVSRLTDVGGPPGRIPRSAGGTGRVEGEDVVRRWVEQQPAGTVFSLAQAYRKLLPEIHERLPQLAEPQALVRRAMQRLRDDGVLEFVDQQGTYRRRDVGPAGRAGR